MAKAVHATVRNETNYGDLVLCRLPSGLEFVTRVFIPASHPDKYELNSFLEYIQRTHGLEVLEVEDIPEFLDEIRLELSHATSLSNHYIYVLRNDDIRPLAVELSKYSKATCCVGSHARILACFEDGMLCSSERPLSYFYADLDAETIEKTRF